MQQETLFDSYGRQVSTYAEPMDRFIFGEEYVWSVTDKLMQNSFKTLTAVCSGDSTTAGDNAAGHNPSFVMDKLTPEYGVSVNYAERGHSGSSTLGWNNSHVTNDINDYPNMDIYIMRWGINDGGRGSTRLTDFKTALRSGLQKLRNFKGVDDLVIVLQTPNSTSDFLSTRSYDKNRDERWYEEMIPIIRQAARDFQCVFVDTYAMFRDSNGAGIWLDDPYKDGRGVHPDKAFNYKIMKPVADVLFSHLKNAVHAKNNLINVFEEERVVNANEPIDVYSAGFTIFKTGANFPFEGYVYTDVSANGNIVQKLVKKLDYNASNGINEEATVIQRFADRDSGYTWSRWFDLEENLNLGINFNAYTTNGYGAAKYSMTTNNQLVFTGVLKNTNSTSNYGDLLFTLPQGARPLTKKDFIILSSSNAPGTTNTNYVNGIIRFNKNGTVTVVKGGKYLYLDGCAIKLF